jgi:hypothetical protein
MTRIVTGGTGPKVEHCKKGGQPFAPDVFKDAAGTGLQLLDSTPYRALDLHHP